MILVRGTAPTMVEGISLPTRAYQNPPIPVRTLDWTADT